MSTFNFTAHAKIIYFKKQVVLTESDRLFRLARLNLHKFTCELRLFCENV